VCKHPRLGDANTIPTQITTIIGRNCLNQISELYQRGLSEAQIGYGFGMIPGYGPPDGALSSIALDGSPACKLWIALELERAPSGAPCLMDCGVNPTFKSQMSTPIHPLHQIM